MSDKRSVLFVCLGNICRSPMAEAVFKEVARQKGVADKWHAESAGTAGYHVGSPPDHRTMDVLKNNGIRFEHSAQQLTREDFDRFDFIFGMDPMNMRDLYRKQPKGSRAQLIMLGTFDPEPNSIIMDPYYDADNRGFETCFRQCTRACQSFLDQHK